MAESKTWVFDTETYPNFVLFCAQELESGERFSISLSEDRAVERLCAFIEYPEHEFLGFNSNYFDDVIVNAWAAGKTMGQIKALANRLIEKDEAPWSVNRTLAYRTFESIDIMGAAPGFVGLKTLGARMHMPCLQDLPYHHNRELSESEKQEVLEYCWNDVETTVALARRLNDQLMLRVGMSRIYGMDLRSKSDAQLAERTLAATLGLKSKSQPSPPPFVRYKAPEYLSFADPVTQELLQRVSATQFYLGSSGHVEMPGFLSAPLQLPHGFYQLGVGGVHSRHDRKVCHVAGKDDVIVDIDAASFYPSIIIECGFVPAGLGVRFVEEFKRIYERRLQAKREGDKNTDASLKVTINSVFGQFGNRWSVLYAPDLMLAVTLTGQLTLLMLMERLYAAGAQILSANTDGIAVKYRRVKEPDILSTVEEFSKLSRYKFEFTPYRVLAMKDVNNYIAVKPDRSVKAKGIYAPPDLRKNPTASVCAKAVAEWLANGTPLLSTVKQGKITEFLSARNVTGGGVQGEKYLGKVVRWYNSTDKSLPPLTYAKNGNKVPKTLGARALMRIESYDSVPPDLDYEWYYAESIRIAVDVGCRAYLSAEQIELITPPPRAKRTGKPRKLKNEL